MGEENLEILMKKYNLLKNWAAKQPLPVEAAVNTVPGAVFGGVYGFAINGLFRRVCSFPKESLKSLDRRVYSLIRVSSLHMALFEATLLGVNDGLNCVMNRLRGKEDIQTRMVAGFGSGVMALLATRVTGCHAIPGRVVIPFGVVVALELGGLFKLECQMRNRMLIQRESLKKYR